MSDDTVNTQPTFQDFLETQFKGIILDHLFTRKHLRELRNLIDRVKTGGLDQKYLIGFLTTDRHGTTLPEHSGLAGTMWRFVTEEMYELLKAKYGKEEGIRIYHELFDTYLNAEGLVDEDGDINLKTAEAYIGILENAFSQIELTVFVPSLETTKKYLQHALAEKQSWITKFRVAIDNNNGDLPNGRKVTEEDIKETEARIEGYKDALVRLGYTKDDVARFLLSNAMESDE